MWVKAIDAYHKIAEVVAPKREKLKKAELLVKRQMKKLETRRKALQVHLGNSSFYTTSVCNFRLSDSTAEPYHFILPFRLGTRKD